MTVYNNKKGYTLIELIIVLTLIGILTSIVVVDQVSYYNKLSLRPR